MIRWRWLFLKTLCARKSICDALPNGSGGWIYEYVLKDHLGNGRVWFAPNAAGSATVTRQEVHYDPFGFELEGINGATAPTSPANAYHYNGKELNTEFGIGWLDYGARWFEAALGRWWSVDPMGEKTVSRSVFAYTSNNPLKFVDPDGMYGREFSLVDEVRRRALGRDLADNEMFKNIGNEQRAKTEKSDSPTSENQSTSNVSQTTGTVNITVTSEIIGTAKLISGPYYYGKEPTAYYYEVNTYQMIVEGIDKDGNPICAEFEVIRYGVKKSTTSSEPFYQGFGGTESDPFPQNEIQGTVSEFFYGNYTYGAFRVQGEYLIHKGIDFPTDIPKSTNGRFNKGCIGVCGRRQYDEFKNTIARITGSNDHSVNASSGLINVTVQPITIHGNPTPIKKKTCCVLIINKL